MSFRDLIHDVFRTLWAHRVRTLLTMFGIAWGVVSIILMVAAGEGLRVGQAKQAETLGRDIMIVFHGRTSLQAGGTRAGRLVRWVDSDIPHLQTEATACQYAIPELEQNDVRSHTNFNAAAFTVTGSMPEFGEIRSLGVSEGRFYNYDDIREGRRVEGQQVLDLLAHAHVADGDAELAHDGHRHAALGGVEHHLHHADLLLPDILFGLGLVANAQTPKPVAFTTAPKLQIGKLKSGEKWKIAGWRYCFPVAAPIAVPIPGMAEPIAAPSAIPPTAPALAPTIPPATEAPVVPMFLKA